IDIVHEDSPGKFSVAQRVKTEYGAKTMALDPKTHNLYVDTADFVRATPVSGARKGLQLQPKPGTLHLLIYGL
ncbi:MAG: YncE family protein, partial [Bryobacteraceae bacterium]